MRADDLCNFCAGMGGFFFLRRERPAWWPCRPCLGTGVSHQPLAQNLKTSPGQRQFYRDAEGKKRR